MLIDEAKQKLHNGVDKLTADKRIAEGIVGISDPNSKVLVDKAIAEFEETVAEIFKDLDSDQHQALMDYASDQFPRYSSYVKPSNDVSKRFKFGT